MRNFRFRLPAGLFCLALFVGCSASPSDPGSNPQCLSGSSISCTPQTDGPPPPTDAGTSPAPDLFPVMSPDMTPPPANPDLAAQHATKPPGAEMLDGDWIKCIATVNGKESSPYRANGCQATQESMLCLGHFECWWEDVDKNMSPTNFKCSKLTLSPDTSVSCERI